MFDITSIKCSWIFIMFTTSTTPNISGIPRCSQPGSSSVNSLHKTKVNVTTYWAVINNAAEWPLSLGRKEGEHAWRSLPALCVRVLEGWGVEAAKSGLRGGLQSSTPWLWVAFDVVRHLWWARPWRNVTPPTLKSLQSCGMRCKLLPLGLLEWD